MTAGTGQRTHGPARRGIRAAGTALIVALTLGFGSACIDTGPSEDGEQQEQRDPGQNQDGNQEDGEQEDGEDD